MEATIEIPESIAQSLGYTPTALPRRALEALLIDECVRGRISRGKVAELLGLGFHEAEELFQASHVPYPAKNSEDDALANSLLPPRS